tara:strand:- start:4249 stop:5229 length:981 start_codon:yes stop_codon:yes gene_type:complete
MIDQEDLKIARSVLNTEAESILKAAKNIDSTFKNAIDILDSSKQKIIVTGIGKSGHVGKKISSTLCSTGSPSCFLHPAEAVHGDLGIHQKGDPVIFLSNSGSTPELLSLEPVLRKRNAKIVGILGKTRSKLTDKVDVALDASVTIEADPLGIVPTASFAVAASLGDAIASALMKRKKFSENDYAITHPAGQLGRNLILNVEDVMHRPNKIACVMEKTSIKDVVLKMSTFPLGAACVINEGNDLVGVITDGDLRRALQRFEDIRDIKAKLIMTPNPITVSPTISLGEALKVMEDRESQVSILPVVEKLNDSILGLIRIHDIYDPGKL